MSEKGKEAFFPLFFARTSKKAAAVRRGFQSLRHLQRGWGLVRIFTARIFDVTGRFYHSDN